MPIIRENFYRQGGAILQGFLKVETKSAFTAESAKNAEKNLKNSANPAFSAVNFWYSTNLRKP